VAREAMAGAALRVLRKPGGRLYFGAEVAWLQRRGAHFVITVGAVQSK
jgi:hypothetical protein